jgi:PAP2 superfamily
MRTGPTAAIAGCVLAALPVAPAVASAPSAQPWHLASRQELRLPPAPGAQSPATRREVRELVHLQRVRSARMERLARRWNAEPAVLRWTRVALRMIRLYRPRPPFAARALALLATGMEDAAIAASDSRAAHRGTTRPPPARLDPRIHPSLRERAASSYAPVEAAVAGAAERILTYLFPGEPARTFRRFAREATSSRLWAGLNYRSDVERARTLGHEVAARVIARGESDGHANTRVSGERLSGEPFWAPTPPSFEPPLGGPVGTWTPWLMGAPSQLRGVLSGPSPYGSPAFMAELQRVLDVEARLTDEQKQIATFWDDGPGTLTPAGHWVDIAASLIAASRVNTVRAAHILAHLAVAEADAAIAVFEAKYHWWSIRPITAIWRLCDGGVRLCSEAELQADPGRATHRGRWSSYITTPAFPSYPGGHSTFSGAAARVLGHFFPAARRSLERLARQAARSRLYGGIHFDEDNRAGLALGRAVGDLAIQRSRR